MFCMDIKQLCVMKGDPRLPKQEGNEHNALADARWNKECWDFLQAIDHRAWEQKYNDGFDAGYAAHQEEEAMREPFNDL